MNVFAVFYTMQPKPPFRILATSNEFCIGSQQDASDCESVQFISGAELEVDGEGEQDSAHRAASARLLLSYGINDCEAKLAKSKKLRSPQAGRTRRRPALGQVLSRR